MTAMQRRKGQCGERELFRILSEHLGTIVRRNVDQARAGGADGLEIDGWAVEVKRQEKILLSAWWDQAESQAMAAERRPILFYRASRCPWRAVIDLHDISPATFPLRGSTAIVELSTAVQIFREMQ